jgi:hypothetical protein
MKKLTAKLAKDAKKKGFLCALRVLSGSKLASFMFNRFTYGKIASASDKSRFPWRDGRAAEGACLENMFGESQRGFESHSLRLTIRV